MALPVELRGHAPPSRRIGRGVPAYAGGMPPARHAETPTRPRTAGTMIRIHAKAPAKPRQGSACNGCGVCCLAEPCPLGMLLSGRRSGACSALRWSDDEGRYRCGALTVPLLRPLASRWIAAGRGCDSDAELDTAVDAAIDADRD